MAWKKVILSTTADQMVFTQNTSAIKNSIVRIAFTDTDREPTATSGIFILSGPNTWNGRIKKGSYMWFEEQQGGIFTYTAYDIEPIKNYNIASVHKDIVTNNDVIDVPEGAYFVIQNKSEDTVFFSIVGEGTFAITKYQILTFTFTRDTQIRIKGTGKDVSYFYGEAPSLTQLSLETKTMLEDIKTSVEMLKTNSVTRNELLEVSKKTYYDRYSPDVSTVVSVVNPNNQTTEVELPLLETDSDFDSEILREKEMLDFILAIKYNDGTSPMESAMNISARISKTDLVLPVIDMDIYDTVVAMMVEEIKLEWNEDQGTLKPTVILNNWNYKDTEKYAGISEIFKAPLTVSLRVKSELAVWKPSNKVFIAKNTNKLIHSNARFNKRAHFSTETSYNGLINTVGRHSHTKVADVIFSNKEILRANKQTDTGLNAEVYTIYDINESITVKLIRLSDTRCNLEVHLGNTFTVDDNQKLSCVIIENLADPSLSINLNMDLLEDVKTARAINKTATDKIWTVSLYIPSNTTANIYSDLFDRFVALNSAKTGIIKIITRKGDV